MREWYTYDKELRSYAGVGGDIVVPTEINGHRLSVINDYSFSPLKKGLKPEVKEKRLDISSVVVEDGYMYMGKSAFEGCENLSSIKIPDSIQYIDENAFAKTGIETISIPKASVGNEVCSECVNLTKAEINDEVESLGNELFFGCIQLRELHLPDSLKAVPCGLLRYCEKLQHITIPEDVREICDYAFEGCSIEEITIPPKVTTIEAAAFKDCKKLKSVRFEGQSIKRIGQWAFSGCEELEEIIIPDGVQWMSGDVFYNCKRLTKVIIPADVERIETSCFIGADSLTQIVIKGDSTRIVELDQAKHFAPHKGITVIAPSGSFAEKYAMENGIHFQSIDRVD